MKPSFMIAATSSGSGKTTLSLGLMRALTNRNIVVQPFKCGPDYIDTQYHRISTGRDSVNLDLFMSSERHVKELFGRYSESADVSIIEGAMGMFDGFDGMNGSAADIARTLDVPVVLLINAASTSFSVAATIYGFTRFCPDVKVTGVIFNRVASENHYAFLKEACEIINVVNLGYIRKNESLQTPSRHLGLSLDSLSEIERFVDAAAKEVGSTVDINGLLEATMIDCRQMPSVVQSKRNLTVAVARDEAFNFIYPANVERFNANIVYFSPLHDKAIPKADLVYLPGGYPELYADDLEENREMRTAIKNFAEKDGKILAECGGMIYLSEEINGKKMCGVFPLKASMKNARLKLGYRRVKFDNFEISGHEFHYSDTLDLSGLPSVAQQYNIRSEKVATPVYRYKNVFAGYTHFYWAETDIFKLWE
ncbi:cobyrinate a,c-diamide synthase [Muribaculum sp. NM65_B17]|uniref:cobyrinate a,c-diamide synthase n=1 Tax=Muribaculum sp. NM65_B17 TaxID=2516961 RepID=UPI0010933901|nr:cobyrinate a,c-diamide synthase [Muribaculum sp. NM65_B17]TGY02685.1 cobyrinate a,c-diamide synthase [Muribaculum sp. NM65_B17]THG43513.1 cobyrinate a,c-diamide synthase [Muribaculaceae bacterium]